MKICIRAVFVILLCGVFLYAAIQAPYLISITAMGTNSVKLSWRNNSMETNSFTVLRKAANESAFKTVMSLDKGTTTYTDSLLAPSTKYYYGIIACLSSSECSDTSNIDSALTFTEPFQPPTISTQWDVTEKKIKISTTNRSAYKEYLTMYSSKNHGDFPVNPEIENAIIEHDSVFKWTKSDVDFNSEYAYKFIIKNEKDSVVYTEIDTTYTLDYKTRLPSYLRTIDTLIKVSEFPINLYLSRDYLGTLTLKAGDTILIAEKNTSETTYGPPYGDSLFSIIDISDVTNPKFKGYVTSKFKWGYSYNFINAVIIKNTLLFNNESSSLQGIKYNNGKFDAIELKYPEPNYYNGFLFGSIDDSTVVGFRGINSSLQFTRFKVTDFSFSEIIDTGSAQLLGTAANFAGSRPNQYTTPKILDKKVYFYLQYERLTSPSSFDIWYTTWIVDCSSSKPYIFNLSSLADRNDLTNIPTVIDSMVIPPIGRVQYLDKSKKTLFIIKDSSLIVYQYKNEIPYVAPVGIKQILPTIKKDLPFTFRLKKNPGSSLSIEFSEQVAINHIAIFNSLGKRITEFNSVHSKTIEWNTRGLSKGMYFAQINAMGKMYLNKIMVMK
jgi:hypothetical protein